MSEFLGFLALAVLVIVTPGPDTAVTIRSAIVGGRRAGTWTALGVVSGQFCWTLAASLGLTALLLASEPVFVGLKLLGALYLVYLGVVSIRSAVRAHRPSDKTGRPAADSGGGRPYRQGLLSDLANPKMAAFFATLLPQFAAGDGLQSFATMMVLGIVFGLLTLTWLTAYSFAISSAAGLLNRTPVRRAIEAITGTVLVALGLRLAAHQR